MPSIRPSAQAHSSCSSAALLRVYAHGCRRDVRRLKPRQAAYPGFAGTARRRKHLPTSSGLRRSPLGFPVVRGRLLLRAHAHLKPRILLAAAHHFPSGGRCQANPLRRTRRAPLAGATRPHPSTSRTSLRASSTSSATSSLSPGPAALERPASACRTRPRVADARGHHRAASRAPIIVVPRPGRSLWLRHAPGGAKVSWRE